MDLLDPSIPVEVKKAALAEAERDPFEARKKNPPEYEAERQRAMLAGEL